MTVQAKLTSVQAPASAAEFAAMYDIPYRKAVGALQVTVNWAALATRPGISFAVSMFTVAGFASNPGPTH